MTRTTARLTGTLLAGTLLLAGCADDSSNTAHSGSMASHDSASSSASARSEDAFNDADVTFAQQMIPHHQSAIAMAQLAQGRAEDPRVLNLAGRIEAAQVPEIDTLTGWLAEWGISDTGSTDDGMGGMDHGEGMMSEQDMTALMNTSGAEFDRMFLEQMIEHHSGAVDMAVTEVADGQNPDAIAMAETIRDTQNAEIAEMRQLLTEIAD
jgi:uncharacterized protein (DUF305 family)